MMNEWIEGWMDRHKVGQTDGQTNGQMAGGQKG